MRRAIQPVGCEIIRIRRHVKDAASQEYPKAMVTRGMGRMQKDFSSNTRPATKKVNAHLSGRGFLKRNCRTAGLRQAIAASIPNAMVSARHASDPFSQESGKY